jgi:hypothetical protein
VLSQKLLPREAAARGTRGVVALGGEVLVDAEEQVEAPVVVDVGGEHRPREAGVVEGGRKDSPHAASATVSATTMARRRRAPSDRSQTPFTEKMQNPPSQVRQAHLM